MPSYGIMQGRLTPSRGRGIQFFPFEEWEEEFPLAEKMGFNEIEWIFDYNNYEGNPIWTKKGCTRIIKRIKDNNIVVNSLCFDYFMRRPFFKEEAEVRGRLLKENVEIGKKILENLTNIGGNLMEIPFVDNSSIKTIEQEELAGEYIIKMAREASQYNIDIGLEMDFTYPRFAEFIRKLDCKNVFANYDSGNSSGLGYDAESELKSLRELVRNVHIKDRVYQGNTVKLGRGSADFDKVFKSLKDIDYKRSFILQAARAVDGDEVATVREQLEFLKKYIGKYTI